MLHKPLDVLGAILVVLRHVEDVLVVFLHLCAVLVHLGQVVAPCLLIFVVCVEGRSVCRHSILVLTKIYGSHARIVGVAVLAVVGESEVVVVARAQVVCRGRRAGGRLVFQAVEGDVGFARGPFEPRVAAVEVVFGGELYGVVARVEVIADLRVGVGEVVEDLYLVVTAAAAPRQMPLKRAHVARQWLYLNVPCLDARLTRGGAA